MVILTAIAILSMPYLLIKLILAEAARTPHSGRPQQGWAEASGWAGEKSRNKSAWSALDDRQLVGLLTDAAPQTSSD